jgi:hypothetical protein
MNELNFAFDFNAEDRSALLDEGKRTILALYSNLGPGEATRDAAAEAATEAAARLLTQLNQEVAQFSEFPEVLQLKEEHFTQHGLEVPQRFHELGEHYRFYWLYFPITLFPLENFPFAKIELAVEFNPGVAEGHLRPRAHMILPDKKFEQLLEFSNSLEVGIGEDFEFKATSGAIGADVEARLAGKLGLVAGPFKYTLKKALIEHSAVGAEKVFWRVVGAEFFQENDLTFIVVLQVPRSIENVSIAAALQAYHQANIGAMGLTQFIRFLRTQLANFFRVGSPVRDTQVWDITSRL